MSTPPGHWLIAGGISCYESDFFASSSHDLKDPLTSFSRFFSFLFILLFSSLISSFKHVLNFFVHVPHLAVSFVRECRFAPGESSGDRRHIAGVRDSPPPHCTTALVVEDVIPAVSWNWRLYSAIFVLGVASSRRPGYRGPTSGVETMTDLRWLSGPPRGRNES